ncbi:hypothetical protein F4775DRAFT_168189 [Biscogniauxia sp. FL1348]|nr:hypothetical protein F4775DRAFT_168189 [Biscogniauxia sp. FL1348]
MSWIANPQYPCAVDDAFQHILEVVEKRNLRGKAAINLSLGVHIWVPEVVPYYFQRLDLIFRRHILKMAELGVIVVISSIKNGYEQLMFVPIGDSYPQALGTPDNNIVTVGAVGRNGILQPWSSPDDSSTRGSPGSITVYAQGNDVEFIGRGGYIVLEGGVSFAVPQVVSPPPPTGTK